MKKKPTHAFENNEFWWNSLRQLNKQAEQEIKVKKLKSI